MVHQISPHDLAEQRASGQRVLLVDVRQPLEHQLAALPESLLIPLNDLGHRSKEIPADGSTIIVVYCHHGIRSLSAAAFLERLGFGNVQSLIGGIDAWSCEVDPAVPRY